MLLLAFVGCCTAQAVPLPSPPPLMPSLPCCRVQALCHLTHDDNHQHDNQRSAPLDPEPNADPIITAHYPDFESFWAKVQEAWAAQWQTVFGADWQGAWRWKGWGVAV